MSKTTKVVGVGAVVLSGAFILGAVCGNGGFGPYPPVTTDQTGDCDAGDLRESTPDPDCKGLWLGTPTPGAKKTTPTPATKIKPSPSRSRRR